MLSMFSSELLSTVRFSLFVYKVAVEDDSCPSVCECEQVHFAAASHLHDVVSRFDVRDVDPLAVDVVAVQIPAAHGDALIAKVGALVPLGNT